jgi:Spy/CpxP family protein refolding chaperone
VSTSYAQQIPKAREQRLVALGKQLHVTGKQARQLMPILKAEEPQLQAIRNDRSLSRAERLRRLQAVHRQSDPQVKAILTPQQYQQLQVIRQQRRAQIMQAARSNPHQGGAARSQK